MRVVGQPVRLTVPVDQFDQPQRTVIAVLQPLARRVDAFDRKPLHLVAISGPAPHAVHVDEQSSHGVVAESFLAAVGVADGHETVDLIPAVTHAVPQRIGPGDEPAASIPFEAGLRP